MQFACVDDYEVEAKRILNSEIYNFFAGGAQNERTLKANLSGFDNLMFQPRALTGGFDGILETSLLGTKLSMPVLVAPTAFHCLVDKDGECATANATQSTDTLMIISMASTKSVEEIINSLESNKATNKFWFQIYIQPDKEFTLEIIKRAEKMGCIGLVVTVDSPVFGKRLRDIHNNFNELPNGLCCPNMIPIGSDKPCNIEFDHHLTWKDIVWLKSVTNLPIILKGIMHPEDAKLSLDNGIDGIIVSNHGGRQLDSLPATIDVLPSIAKLINKKIPIILDGGIRCGGDIVKAMALGATAVAVGRPIIWGLAVNGVNGVKHILQILHEELINTLHLCGCNSLDSLYFSFANSGYIRKSPS